jgi:hypothetical protein
MTSEQKSACLLGYSGLIPFFVLACVAVVSDGEAAQQSARALLLYAAIILSFMGGVVWGRGLAGMRDEGLVASLVISVIPALVAWAGAVLGGSGGAALCCLGLVGLLVHDLRTKALPAWFRRLRLHLTVGAVLATGSLIVL